MFRAEQHHAFDEKQRFRFAWKAAASLRLSEAIAIAAAA